MLYIQYYLVILLRAYISDFGYYYIILVDGKYSPKRNKLYSLLTFNYIVYGSISG